MARVGGRNTLFAWTVGLVCAGVIGALAWLAAPLVPQAATFVGAQFAPPTSDPVAGDDEVAGTSPSECRDLYDDALWRSLRWADDALLTPSTDAPLTAAAGLVDALAPGVQLTCTWTSAEGTVSTTLATVPADAGAIAQAALPALGFDCQSVAGRVQCVLEVDGRRDTIDTAGGVWLSSVEDGWHPSRYAESVAERVWAP